MDSISEAKEFLRENFEKGCKCPACDQFVKLYKRNLSANMARAIILISRAPTINQNGWVDIRSVDLRNGDYARLRFWGLIEQRKNQDTKKKDSGIWRVTHEGMKFINDQIRVPSHVYVYDNKIIKWSDELVNIRQALKKSFDYNKLMSD